MTHAQHKEQVRREAIAAGMAPDAAQFLADQQGKQPTQAEREMTSPRTSNHGARAARTATPAARGRTLTVDDRRARICGLYKAAALVPELKAAGLSLRAVAALLANANDGRTLTPAGCANVRNQLTVNNHWGAS